MKRVFISPGSKWNIAKQLCDYIPEHKVYVELFFGSGAVFFNKKKSNLEVVNDMNSNIANLFKIVRDNPTALANLINMTPYSKDEYLSSYEQKGESDLEKARIFLVRTFMARAGMQYYSSSWRHTGVVRGSMSRQTVAQSWNNMPEIIIQTSSRLKEAEIENKEATKIAESYNHKDAFLFVDPPYLLETRKQRYYEYEMTEKEEHVKLLEILKKSKSKVMITHYSCDLYDDMLSDWNYVDIEANAEQGKKRVERVYMNYTINKQLSLF